MNLLNGSRSALLVLALLASGCGALTRLEVRDDLSDYRERHATPRAAAAPASNAASVSVALVASKSLMVQFARPVKVGDGFTGVALEPMRDPNHAAPGAFVILGGGQAAEEILRLQLSRSVANASVRMVPNAEAAAANEVVVTMAGIQFYGGLFGKTVNVALSARLPDGRMLQAFGRPRPASTGGHLGWAIPTLIVTGLTGLAFMGPTFAAIGAGIDEAKYIEALDLASASLAAQIQQSNDIAR